MSTVDKNTKVKLGVAIAIVVVVCLAGVVGYIGNEAAPSQSSSQSNSWG